MQQTASELATLIHQYSDRLYGLKEENVSIKPSPAKWSKKEILGHLIDSAQSNIRRFIVAQYEEQPFIKYNQDAWVTITGYQTHEFKSIVDLWKLMNLHIVRILSNLTPEMAQRTVKTNEVRTVEWLAIDYIKHLRHHVHQVLDLEAVPYP
jgi:hypothetical protein